MKKWIFCLLLCFLASSIFAADFYVSEENGKNSNPGTKAKPFKNIEKALGKTKTGDKIYVATGNYFGLRGKGRLEIKYPVELYGGYSSDFSTRDIIKYPTRIQPDNKSAKKSRKAVVELKKSKKGEKFVIDGFIFDMGMKNSYSDNDGKPQNVETGMLLLPPKVNKKKKDAPTVEKPIIYFGAPASAGDVTIKNNVFVNAPNYAIQGGHKQGVFKILNNVFIANRMAAVEVYGTGGKKGPSGPTAKDGHLEFAYNTVLFTWSRLKDFKDMGYGVRVMTKLSYDIHNNIFGGNVLTGVDHTRFNKDEWLKIDNNMFFANKQGDLMYSEAGLNTLERIFVDELEDFEFDSAADNTAEIPSLKINKAYLEGFLSASYSEEEDFDADSSSNQFRAAMGLNKQGKLKTKVSMFANRYPWKETLKLFGGVKDRGAQLPQ